MSQPTTIDDQPISATFFDEGQWLTSFVTPNVLEVKELYEHITQNVDALEDKLIACWDWVAGKVKYVKFVRAKLWVNGRASVQSDYWQKPSQLIRTRVGNCANKAFLLASLVRNSLPEGSVHCVLGNLNQGRDPGGHAWVQVNVDDVEYIMESTRGDMQPLVVSNVAEIYEPVVYFNDEGVSAIEGRTLLVPFTAVYADWLRDYLDWIYINGEGRGITQGRGKL